MCSSPKRKRRETLEVILQRELEIPCSHGCIHHSRWYPGRVRRVGSVPRLVDSATWEDIGRVSRHSEDRGIERVDRVEPELERLMLGDSELLGHAHVDLPQPGSALARDRTRAELSRSWNRHRGRIEPHISAAGEVLER